MPSLESPAARTADAERPDASYWTAYDHFMIEREARAMRRAYAWSLLVHSWDRLRARIAGARRDGGHRGVQRLTPRT